MRFPLFLCAALGCATALPAFAGSEHLELNTALWGAGTYRDVLDNDFNPQNAFARIPRDTETFEVRPDWNLKSTKWHITARPRLLAKHETTNALGITTNKNLALLRWSEAFATWNATEAFSIDYGLQNFQWGPAESVSPSNRIFRDTIQVKDSLYLVKGQHLIRLSYTPSSTFSEILMFEPTGNGDAEPEPNEPHSLKGALKTELSWAGGADFAGLVNSWRDREGFSVGEYLNLELFSGFYAYADAEQQAGTLAYYPVSNNGLVTYSQTMRGDPKLKNFIVGGLRYAFENGNDWRIEGIYQANGYTTTDLTNARSAISSKNPVQLAVLSIQSNAAALSGLDFPSQAYLFSSIRFPNVFGWRDWNIYLRGLESLQDHSVSGFVSSENSVGVHGTFIGAVTGTAGTDGAELKGVVDLAATLAYRHAW